MKNRFEFQSGLLNSFTLQKGINLFPLPVMGYIVLIVYGEIIVILKKNLLIQYSLAKKNYSDNPRYDLALNLAVLEFLLCNIALKLYKHFTNIF